MFPAGMFAKSYFAGTYFPPVVDVTPVVPPTFPRYGHRRRNEPIPQGWPIDLDDEELMFWLL